MHSHANTTSPFIQCDTLLALPRAQCSHTALTPHLSLTVTEAHSDLVPYLALHHTQPRTSSPVLTPPPFLSVTPSPPSQLAFTWTATLLSPPAPAGVRVSKVLPFTPYIDFCFHWTGSQPEPKNHETALRGLWRPPVIRVL